MSHQEPIVTGSGNVFADLGLPGADDALAKADLAICLTRIIRARGWSQRQAAVALGIDQPKVSALMRGLIGGFSVERLLRLLNTAGYDVEIDLRPVGSPGKAGATTVRTMVEGAPQEPRQLHQFDESDSSDRQPPEPGSEFAAGSHP